MLQKSCLVKLGTSQAYQRVKSDKFLQQISEHKLTGFFENSVSLHGAVVTWKEIIHVLPVHDRDKENRKTSVKITRVSDTQS